MYQSRCWAGLAHGSNASLSSLLSPGRSMPPEPSSTSYVGQDPSFLESSGKDLDLMVMGYSVNANAFSTNIHSCTSQHPCLGGRRSCCIVQRNLRSRPFSGFKSTSTVCIAPLVCDPAITGPTFTFVHFFALTMEAKIGLEANAIKFSKLPPRAALHRSDEKLKHTSKPELAFGSSFLINESMHVSTISSADNSGEGCGRHMPSPEYPISNNSPNASGVCGDCPKSGGNVGRTLYACEKVNRKEVVKAKQKQHNADNRRPIARFI